MKGAAIALLPLAVSAVVIPEARHEQSKRQTASSGTIPLGDNLLSGLASYFNTPGTSSAPQGKTWMDTLSTLGGYLNKGYQAVNGAAQGYNQIQDTIEKKLPGALYTAIPGLATILQWTAKPTYVGAVKATLEPTLARKAVFRYGPFELLGQKYERKNVLPFYMDKKADIIIRQLKGLPQNSAILSGRMDTVFEDGSKADIGQGIYIHHLLVADLGKNTAPFAACPGGRNQKSIPDWLAYHVVSAVGAGLIQSGNDQVGDANTYYTKEDGMKSAFLTSFDDAFLLEAEVVNYNQENTTVYLQFEAEYIPDKPEGFMDASTVLFSATGCGSPGYRPPAGAKQYNSTSESFQMDYDGVIINNRGHLHDGGVAMHMLLNNKLVCESLPTYGGAPGAAKGPDGKEWQTILSMSKCNKPVPFKRGDEVKLVSIYDLDKHPLRAGADSGHAHGGEKKEGSTEGGMEGMEEMGIMTTNIAVNSKQMVMPASPQSQPAKSNGTTAPPAQPAKGNSTMASMGHSGKSNGTASSSAAHSHGRRSEVHERLLRRTGSMPEEAWPVVLPA